MRQQGSFSFPDWEVDIISQKTYLSQQIRLMTLATYDLFTDTEFYIYQRIISLMNEIDRQKQEAKGVKKTLIDDLQPLYQQKKELQAALADEISRHQGTPRTVRLQNMLDTRKLPRQDGEVVMPPGVTWRTLRLSHKIAEFASEESRLLGLRENEVTFDKIIVKWKSVDVLEQIVLDGFTVPVLQPDGTVKTIHYHVMTASAGQLRVDKCQAISDEAWEKIRVPLECGLTWEVINSKGGCNINKYAAYLALNTSATDRWEDFDIDRAIVIDDFEAPVSGLMQKINADYSFDKQIHTVLINHIDGCGIYLPSVDRKSKMVRGPWFKGLLTPFDYLRFCEEHGVQPVIQDIYGKQHDLAAEDIRILFTKSQFKMWKYYDSWDQYKQLFKECGCHFSCTNYEEDFIPDSTLSYQMIQTLQDFSDEEIERFTQRNYDRIEGIAVDKQTMLRVMGADIDSEDPYLRLLAMYPELLRDAYTRDTLRAVKKRWTLDAKSGRIITQKKRLFVIPDLYAACEFWFLHETEPNGLLQHDEVACRVFRHKEKVDCLRSPHLYMEHAVRRVCHDPKVYDWFITDGIYTSCKDLVSRILQFDCDGDMLDVVADDLFIEIAERNIEKYEIIPLFYDANKAPSEMLSREILFRGLKRAHDYSGIGQVSNSLTKLWNRDHPDLTAAAWLCFYNNQVIDAAKTGKINSYENYPEINARIKKAIGGRNGQMPYFFQFSRNGRRQATDAKNKRKQYASQNHSTMNRFCRRFQSIGNINMNYAGIAPFNWQMLLPEGIVDFDDAIAKRFIELDNLNHANEIESGDQIEYGERLRVGAFDLATEEIVEQLIQEYGSLMDVYPSILRYLFAGEGQNRSAHKRTFWKIFGYYALAAYETNLQNSHRCPVCNMLLPSWAEQEEPHRCNSRTRGFFECVDCGTWCVRRNSKQTRCPSCQEIYTRLNNNRLHAEYNQIKREMGA